MKSKKIIKKSLSCDIDKYLNDNTWFLDGDGNIPSGFDKDGNFEPNKYDPGSNYKIKGKTFRLKSNPNFEIEDAFDINNLRFFYKQGVIDALDNLNDIAQYDNVKEIVCMIGTGGTIASYIDKDGKVRPGLSIEYLLDYAGSGLKKRFNLACYQIAKLIPSSQMEIDYIADLCISMCWIYKNLSYDAKNLFAGFMVTHGTDTLSTSATYLNAMLGANYPFSVAFVGSQKTIDDKFTDVGINFSFGLNMLSNLRQKRKNIVFICMGGHSGGAYIPAATIKISDTEANAFGCPGRKKIMDSSDFISHGIYTPFFDEKEKERTVEDIFQPIIFRGYVPLTTLHAKMGLEPKKLYEFVKATKELAIILVTYGSFSFNYKQIDAIVKAATETNTIVMAVNPFPTGKTDHLYEETYYLIESGIIPVHALEHAVYAKVKRGQIVFGNDIKKIKMFLIGNNFMGEQPDEWDQPLEILQEGHKLNGYKIKKYGQPRESFLKT